MQIPAGGGKAARFNWKPVELVPHNRAVKKKRRKVAKRLTCVMFLIFRKRGPGTAPLPLTVKPVVGGNSPKKTARVATEVSPFCIIMPGHAQPIARVG